MAGLQDAQFTPIRTVDWSELMAKSRRRRIDDARIAKEQLLDPDRQREIREATEDKRAKKLFAKLGRKWESLPW